MSLTNFLRHLESRPGYRGQIAHVEEIPGRPARWAVPAEPVHPALEEALRRLRHRRDQDEDARHRVQRLTPRERQILEQMATGAPPDRIAQTLGMSPNTLRTHMQNILTKLGVHSKMEALVLAIRHGVVTTVDLTETVEDAAS